MLNYTIDGKEVTIEHDYDGCTMELEAWEERLEVYGIAIETYDRNSRSFGDLALLKELEDWEEDYNRLISDADPYIGQVGELDKHLRARPQVQTFEYCPYVDIIRYFKVTVDCEKWLEAVGESEFSVEMVKQVVRDFDTVYRGGVWGVEVEGQDPIYGVVFDDELPTENELRELFD